MDVLPALVALVILVVLATLAGIIIRLTQTRVKQMSENGSESPVTPADLFPSGADYRPFGARATFVQFSTQTCRRCPATSRVLGTMAGRNQDVRHIDIDVTDREDLIFKFSVMRTPTVLILDGQGNIQTRVTGPISHEQANNLLEQVSQSASKERAA